MEYHMTFRKDYFELQFMTDFMCGLKPLSPFLLS